jgi:hypothetical protein
LTDVTATLSSVASSLGDLCLQLELKKAPVVYETISPLKNCPGGLSTTAVSSKIVIGEKPISMTPLTYDGDHLGQQLGEFKKPAIDALDHITTTLHKNEDDVNKRKKTPYFY